MDNSGSMMAVVLGLTFLAALVFFALRRHVQPSGAGRRLKQLGEAQDHLVEAEAHLEYYKMYVPMLRERIKRLEKQQADAEKAKQAAEQRAIQRALDAPCA